MMGIFLMKPGTAVLYSQKSEERVELGDIFRVTEFTKGGYTRLTKIELTKEAKDERT